MINIRITIALFFILACYNLAGESIQVDLKKVKYKHVKYNNVRINEIMYDLAQKKNFGYSFEYKSFKFKNCFMVKKVSFDLENVPLERILQVISGKVGGFTWKVYDNKVVNLIQSDLIDDKSWPLNKTIKAFDEKFTPVLAGFIFHRYCDSISRPGGFDGSAFKNINAVNLEFKIPFINIKLKDKTIREILNEAVVRYLQKKIPQYYISGNHDKSSKIMIYFNNIILVK